MQTINKKDIPQELIVDIEKVSNLGFGIAKVDGYVIFVEGACPKDKVKIRLGKKNKNYANAKRNCRYGKIFIRLNRFI